MAPALVTASRHDYDTAFKSLMVIALIAAAVLIALALIALGGSTPHIVLSVVAFLVGVALLGPFVLTRFDLYAAAVTLAAVCASCTDGKRSGPCTGCRDRDKLYPAVLCRCSWREPGDARGARPLLTLALSIGSALLVYLPFAVLAPEESCEASGVSSGRPLQIESLGSGVLLAFHHALGCRSTGHRGRAHRISPARLQPLRRA